MVHAQVEGKNWGAEHSTLPSGVAHLVLPIPDRGMHSITVTDGTSQSTPVNIRVDPRHFNIVDEPNHLVIL